MPDIAVGNPSASGFQAAEAGALSLRIVPSDFVLLHEGVEERRVAELTGRLERDQLLKNPPVVAPVGPDTGSEGRVVVLDGATRVEALRRLGVRDVLVQVVELGREGVALEAWNHLITGASPAVLLEDMAQVDGVALQKMSAHEAGEALERRELLCYLLLPDGTARGAIPQGEGGRFGGTITPFEAELLSRVVATYEGKVAIFRVASRAIEELLRERESVAALVVFPRFDAEEIRRLATRDAKLPAGVTRFVIPGRVLRVDFPLRILRSATPVEVKNNKLEVYVRDRLRSGRVRSYQESVILFDE